MKQHMAMSEGEGSGVLGNMFPHSTGSSRTDGAEVPLGSVLVSRDCLSSYFDGSAVSGSGLGYRSL